jgi:phosphatidylserine decarboxylase
MKLDEPSVVPVTPRSAPITITASDRLRTLIMHVLPHHVLSAMMHTATRIRARAWKNWQIHWFIKRNGVDMDIAQVQGADQFEHFNAYFTRQ